jgi:hypothetical protein
MSSSEPGAPLPDAFRDPLTVQTTAGVVVITGPNALTAALTPEAARNTAQLLIEAAAQAEAQTD